MKCTTLPIALLAVCLAGCSTMAPKYTQPAAPVSSAWPGGPAYRSETANSAQKPLAEIPWREDRKSVV